jgi:hypothetical protein
MIPVIILYLFTAQKHACTHTVTDLLILTGLIFTTGNKRVEGESQRDRERETERVVKGVLDREGGVLCMYHHLSPVGRVLDGWDAVVVRPTSL